MSIENANESLTKAGNVLKQMKKAAQASGSSLSQTERDLHEIVTNLMDAQVQIVNEIVELKKSLPKTD